MDDRAQRAVAQPFHEGRVDPGELGRRRVEEGHAQDRGVLVHGEPRVDLDGAAVADDRDAPAHREGAEVLLEIHVRQHLEDDVHALTSGELQQLVEITRRRVVEDVVGALLRDHPSPLVGPGGADDGETTRPRELDGGDADAAARSVHEDRLAGLAVGAVEERVKGGGVGDVHRRPLRVADVPR